MIDPAMIPDEVVEAVARTMCRQDGIDPDRMQFSQGIPKWALYIEHARAAIAAALAAWPGMDVAYFLPKGRFIMLPSPNVSKYPQEAADD